MNTFEAIIQQIESKLTPRVKVDYDKLVTAGLIYTMHKGPDGAPPLLARLKDSADPVTACALGAINLATKYLPHAAKGKPMPVATVYASHTLMYKALEFVNQAKIATIGEQEIIRAEHIWTNNIFKAFHVTPQQLNQAAKAVHGVTNNPMAMEKIHRSTGYMRDPRSSTPIDMPADEETPMPAAKAGRE